MGHRFGDLVTQRLSRKHGLSQNKLLVVGIFAILAMVAIAILLFKGAIFVLVGFGVSLVLTKIIVATAGIGLLLSTVFGAYQARIKDENNKQSKGEAIWGALQDVTGVTDVIDTFTDPSLSPFQRGMSFGQGVTSIVTIFTGGKISKIINARLPNAFKNPSRGSILRKMIGPTRANQTKGWSLGDGINNLTSKGTEAKWNTVKQRFWKNKAHSNEKLTGKIWNRLNGEKYNNRQMERMRRGLPPQRTNRYTGRPESMELHHTPPQREGGLYDVEPLYPDQHARVDKHRNVSYPIEEPLDLTGYLGALVVQPDTAEDTLVDNVEPYVDETLDTLFNQLENN